jgi:SAM-dependent methyltransferase
VDARLRQAIANLGSGGYVPGSSATQGYLYNPLPFPGCQGLPCHRPNSAERWNLIKAETDFHGKSVLDLGCATGYFSFKAIQAGASYVLGVDHDVKAIKVCRAAVEAFQVKGAEFLCKTAYVPDEPFDVAFVLSVLNWTGKEFAERFLLWSSKNVPTLWLEIQLKGDGRRGANWLTSDAQIVRWVTGVSLYQNVDAVGQTRGPHRGKLRTLWKCT